MRYEIQRRSKQQRRQHHPAMNHPHPVATFIQRWRERLPVILDTLEALGRARRDEAGWRTA
jgi:hypothetical protein